MAKLVYENNKAIIKDVKAVFFDLDGTLIDSLPFWRSVNRMFFAKYNMDLPDGFIAKTNAMRFEETVAYSCSLIPQKVDVNAAIQEWKNIAIEQYEKTIPLKEGALDYIKQIHDLGIDMYIVTSGEPCMYEPCMKRLGIWKYFKDVFSANLVGVGKASGKIYEYVLQKTGLKSDEIVLFEDALYAVQSANNLGILTIAVYDENGDSFENANLPNHILYSFKNTPLIIDSAK